MRRFQFRLERLLELRRYREREWELKLAQATGLCIMIQNRIKEIDIQTKRTTAALFTRGAIADYAFQISSELFMERLRQERKMREEELIKRKIERDKVQKTYLEYSKKRKVLEKLKEKQEEEYYSQMKKEDFKVMDDMNNGVYTRKLNK